MKKYFPVKPEVGDYVRIEFLDHVEDHDTPIECIVYGKLVAQNKTSLTVECWTCTDPDVNKDNNKRFCIVRRAVSQCAILTEVAVL
jgi:hypothetical protein